MSPASETLRPLPDSSALASRNGVPAFQSPSMSRLICSPSALATSARAAVMPVAAPVSAKVMCRSAGSARFCAQAAHRQRDLLRRERVRRELVERRATRSISRRTPRPNESVRAARSTVVVAARNRQDDLARLLPLAMLASSFSFWRKPSALVSAADATLSAPLSRSSFSRSRPPASLKRPLATSLVSAPKKSRKRGGMRTGDRPVQVGGEAAALRPAGEAASCPSARAARRHRASMPGRVWASGPSPCSASATGGRPSMFSTLATMPSAGSFKREVEIENLGFLGVGRGQRQLPAGAIEPRDVERGVQRAVGELQMPADADLRRKAEHALAEGHQRHVKRPDVHRQRQFGNLEASRLRAAAGLLPAPACA